MWKKLTNKQQSMLVCEASLAKWKPRPWLTVLVFIGVFYAVNIAMSTLLLYPTLKLGMKWIEQVMENLPSNPSPWAVADMVAEFMETIPSWYYQAMLFVTVAEIALPIIFCVKIEERSLRSMGITRRKAVPKFLAGYGIGAGMILCAYGICYAFGGVRFELRENLGEMILPVLLYFLGYLIQGTAEEVLVRGFFFISLSADSRKKNAPLMACLLSAFFFALLHLLNPGMSLLSFFNIFLAGLLFALLVYRSETLWLAAGAHAAWNFVMGQILGVPVSGMGSQESIFRTLSGEAALVSGGRFGLEGGLAVTAVLVAAIAIVMLLPYRKEFDAAEYLTMRKSRKA